MSALRADIITQLKKDILAMQGFKPSLQKAALPALGSINHHFPLAQFPLGVNHEFLCSSKEDLTASCGFIAGILSSLIQKNGAVLWIAATHSIFPPSLVSFGIDPARIIFVHPRNAKEILWTTEEALKYEGLTAVVAEINSIDLIQSRRLQLASEQSRVTGFILRKHQQPAATAFVCRWQVCPLPSETAGELPGIGFPRWKIDLLKARNGKPGSWKFEWTAEGFSEIVLPSTGIVSERKKAV